MLEIYVKRPFFLEKTLNFFSYRSEKTENQVRNEIQHLNATVTTIVERSTRLTTCGEIQGPESLTYLRTLFCAYAKKWPSFVITKLFKMPK